jgi:O-succinylbenzoate synthase
MKIWVAPYSLRASGTSRKGFLIKIKTKDFKEGYADCLPWKIFGDEPVASQIKRLREGNLNELLVRSLYYATLDGQARSRKMSLFEEGVEVRSHYISVDIAELNPKFLTSLSERGFESIKVKVGRNPVSEAKALSSLGAEFVELFKWRLDFNGAGGERFLSRASDEFLSRVEFVEDPGPFDLKKWRALEKKFSVAIALDQAPGADSAAAYGGVRIIKPARSARVPRARDVITNSMDHPVGQSFAYMEAQRFVVARSAQRTDHGLKTNHLSEATPYTRELYDESPFFTASEGYGVGFDKLLKAERWTAL